MKWFSLINKINVGFVAAFFFLGAISYVSYQNANLLSENAAWVGHTHEVTETVETALSQIKDLETGQRGYIITGLDDYLAPFQTGSAAIEVTLDKLQKLTVDNPRQQDRVIELRKIKTAKLEELKESIQIRREKGFQAALQIVNTNVGKKLMREFREVAGQMKLEETKLLEIRNVATSKSTERTLFIIVFGGILAAVIIIGAVILINISENERTLASEKLKERNQIREGLIQLNKKMMGEQSLSELSRNVIETVAEFIGAQVGAIYVNDEAQGTLRWTAGFAFHSTPSTPLEFKLGEGFVGQAARDKKILFVSDIPKDYIKVNSALGDSAPRFLAVFPFVHENSVKGVGELAFFNPISTVFKEYLELGLDNIAIAFNSAEARAQVDELLQKTQVQAEELQSQQEELKTSNEELEEKTDELQTQQEELRQSNEELEEQRATLEEQKSELERTNQEVEKARYEVQQKAEALEVSGKYKSEFLANMSHELRTPLNSILLLSKSLYENPETSLTENQIESSQAIYQSGCDLLNLINDILDLSKVEAGKLDITTAEVELSEIAGNLERVFRQPMALKGLQYTVDIDKKAPKIITTDRFRLEQILKNFISNALKFTEKGSVTVRFEPQGEKSIRISVKDTGIGIAKEKRELVFEAFEQGDGTLNRRYGGTGLGLTIARELAALLGGEVDLDSEEGKGSQFNLQLPVFLEPKGRSKPTPALSSSESLIKAHYEPPGEHFVKHPQQTIPDDREHLKKGEQAILIVEDDPHFAKILVKLCRSRGFKCLVAQDGESALSSVEQFRPDAILLDLRLPGMDGLSVLANLKNNLSTRHIPIHVISVEDKGAEVLKMGALGFLSKPVEKSQLDDALKRIERNLSTKNRKVLIVEDKKVERDAILGLIGDGDVEATAVGSGAEAIEILKTGGFDCMILDLHLSDMTGFQLLEKIEKEESISCPPVIVYTGQDLSKEEIKRLQEFSQSIIIKGVHSEERLYDEATLFLHRIASELPKEKQQMLERIHHREEIFEGKKVLIVDDDMRNVFALRSILLSRGFEIFVGKTGKEALERLEETPQMDIVLMDIMMPEMDGFEAMKRIRAQKRFEHLPMIALTAKAMMGDREKCIDAGANDYLSKPLEMNSLLSLLRVWLTRK